MRFDRSFEAPYGVEVRLSALVARLLAPNPGPFTFRGTGVYILGGGSEVAVIDPGPDDPAHLAALKRAIGTHRISHILVTHTHRDHSPAAAPLKAWSGAKTYGLPLRPSHLSGATGTSPVIATANGGGGPVAAAEGVVDESHDRDFVPDVVLRDGDRISGEGFTLEAVHTPGHTGNHLCYGLIEEQALFSGDHVMGWSTSVIAPPDGNMGDYLASLEKLAARDDRIFYPTHGAPILEPKAWLRALIVHRRMREGQILAALAEGASEVPALAARLYPGLDPRLSDAARAQVQAHLDHLVARGKVTRAGLSYAGVP
jgi:glyoxylase-like metal-dependent hydrolase (beta-lactamase superfamily II)